MGLVPGALKHAISVMISFQSPFRKRKLRIKEEQESKGQPM
jgi:hypothetical protein